VIHVKISYLTNKKRKPFHSNGFTTEVLICFLIILRESTRPNRSQTVEERLRCKYNCSSDLYRPHLILKMELQSWLEVSVFAVSLRTLSRLRPRKKLRISLSFLTSAEALTMVYPCFLRSTWCPKYTHHSLVNARSSNNSTSMETLRST
jgi:hypothetical protein